MYRKIRTTGSIVQVSAPRISIARNVGARLGGERQDPSELHEAGDPSSEGGGHEADEDGPSYAPDEEGGGEQRPSQGQDRRRRTQISQLHRNQREILRSPTEHDSRVDESDDHDEQADGGGNGVLQAFGDSIDDHFADANQREN